jgi:hypothetical protein
MYIYDFVNKFGKKVEKKSSNGTKLSVVKSRQITMKHYKKYITLKIEKYIEPKILLDLISMNYML